jgi:hypothetical protein
LGISALIREAKHKVDRRKYEYLHISLPFLFCGTGFELRASHLLRRFSTA